MKLCHIFPYGGEEFWVILALREFPETKWLILLANKPKILPVVEDKYLLEKIQSREEKDRYEEASFLLKRLQEEENATKDENNLPVGLPPEKRRIYDLIEPPSLDDFHELLRYFRALITFITEQGY